MSVHSLALQISELHSKAFSFFSLPSILLFIYLFKNNGVSVYLGSIPLYTVIDVTSIPHHKIISKCVGS